MTEKSSCSILLFKSILKLCQLILLHVIPLVYDVTLRIIYVSNLLYCFIVLTRLSILQYSPERNISLLSFPCNALESTKGDIFILYMFKLNYTLLQ